MESLLFFIILGLIGSYLSSKSKGRQDQSTPPVLKQPEKRPKVEIKTLDEFAKEIYQQLTEEKKTESQKETLPKVEIKTEQPKVEPVQTNQRTFKKEQPAKKPVVAKQNIPSRQKGTVPSFLTSKEGIVNAIIAQEILGPPKAKKR